MRHFAFLLALLGAGCDFVGGSGPPWNRKRKGGAPAVPEPPGLLPGAVAPAPLPRVPEPPLTRPPAAPPDFQPVSDPSPAFASSRPGEAFEPGASTGVVRPAGASIPGWGTVDDPDRDCTVTEYADGVSISVPGTQHELNPALGRQNAPRVFRQVGGDFRAIVRVTGDFRPTGPTSNPRSSPFRGAGLLVWGDERQFLRLERNSFLSAGQAVCYPPLVEVYDDGRLVGQVGTTAPDAVFRGRSTSLYLERVADRVRVAVSHDGSTWEGWREAVVRLPDRVRVGVSVVNTAEPFTASFDGFQIQQR